MPPRRARLAVLLGSLIAGMTSHSLPAAEPRWGASSPIGTVQIAPGLIADYSYHYDRNAMADAFIAGDSLIALTDAGSLLRFDRATIGLTKESLGPVPATCLGRGEGGAVLAGFADGRVARIDPGSLAMTEIARLPGKPQWVGFTAGGAKPGAKPRLVAVVERTRLDKSRGTQYPVPYSAIHDTGSGETYELKVKDDPGGWRHASAFLLDRRNRLWLGDDRGEWGGWCLYVDLDAGRVIPIPGRQVHGPNEYWFGVYGFAELRDGQVWAYGGMMHLVTMGYVWRVDSGKAEELYQLDNMPPNIRAFRKQQRERSERAAAEATKKGRDLGIPPERAEVAAEPEPEPDPLPTDRPYLPVTHVVEDPRTGSVVVVAFNGVYRTDARLARWEKIHELKIGYQWGRRDAMGAYPSVRSVLSIPGTPGLVFATRFDGLVRLADGKQTDHTLPGQFGGGYVAKIAGSAEGLLALGDRDDGTAWRYRDGGWSPASFEPPYRPHPEAPDAREEENEGGWADTEILVGRDGSIVTVSASSRADPGTRAIARWRGGKPEVLGSEVAMIDPAGCFLAPDGTLWSAQFSHLRRFADGRWVEVGAGAGAYPVPRAEWHELKLNLHAVNDAGPPWILHDPDHRMLFRLTHADGFKDARLASITPEGGGSRRFARAAIPRTKTELLLATEDGLQTFAIDGGRLAKSAIDTQGRSISRLARDGRGRLWLGGDGLAVVDADGKALHPLDDLPMVGRSPISALAADPAHPGGIVAAVEGRGVAFVRVEANEGRSR